MSLLRVGIDLLPGDEYTIYSDRHNASLIVQGKWSLHVWCFETDPEPFCQALEELASAIRSSHRKANPSPSPLHPSAESDTLSIKSSDGAYDAVQVSKASPDDAGCEAQSQAPQEARDTPQSS